MKKAISGILLDSTPNSPDLNHKKNAWQTVMRIDDKILGVKGLGILMLVQQPWADNFFYSHWLCTGTYKDFIHQGLHNSQKK